MPVGVVGKKKGHPFLSQIAQGPYDDQVCGHICLGFATIMTLQA